MQFTLDKIPNFIVENRWDDKLSPQANLLMVFIKTWQKKSGVCSGFDLKLAAKQLHLQKKNIYQYVKECEATKELFISKTPREQFKKRNIYTFRERDKVRYFYLPRKILTLKLSPERKLALIILFRLRDKYSYAIRPIQKRNGKVETLYQTIQRCMKISKRQAQRHIKRLAELGFLNKEHTELIDKHNLLSESWNDLPKERNNEPETSNEQNQDRSGDVEASIGEREEGQSSDGHLPVEDVLLPEDSRVEEHFGKPVPGMVHSVSEPANSERATGHSPVVHRQESNDCKLPSIRRSVVGSIGKATVGENPETDPVLYELLERIKGTPTIG